MRLKLAGVGLLVAIVVTSCGMADSAINELCLIYSGGTFEEKNYKGLLEPGSTAKSVGVGSSTYCYKTDQRSYIANNNKGARDVAQPEVVSKDDVRLTVPYQLYFTINQDEDILREFHENLGVKTDAWKEDGWKQLLREYFEPQIERALEAAALQSNWRDLYASEEARISFNAATISSLKKNIKEVIGNDYFCGPKYTGEGSECGDFTFTVGKPTPVNGDIVAAIESEQTAAANVIAQEQKNEQIRKELEAKRELVELYGPQGALLYEAIKSGKITFMVIDGEGNVSVPAPTQK
jgi:hypothetical protein